MKNIKVFYVVNTYHLNKGGHAPPFIEMIQKLSQKVAKLAEDGDVAVRFWAKKIQTRLNSPSASPKPESKEGLENQDSPGNRAISLTHLLKKVEPIESSFVAIEILRKIFEARDPSIFAALAAYLKKCKDAIQISFLTKNLGIFYPQDETLPILIDYLRHEDERVVANTLEGLEGVGTPPTVALIAQMLEHRSHRVRANAAKILSKHDPAVANKVIGKMLQMTENPHFIVAACHAVKELRALGFLPDLISHVGNSVLEKDALSAISSIFSEAISEFFAKINSLCPDLTIKEKIIQKIEEDFSLQLRQLGLRKAPRSSVPVKQHFLEIGEQKIFALNQKFAIEVAEIKARENRQNAFGLISKYLYRPKEEEIVLIYAETRFEPFWHVSCKTHIEYVRSRELKLETNSQVVRGQIGEKIFQVDNGNLFISLDEHCIEEFESSVFIDAQNGSKMDFSNHVSHEKREIKETEELMVGDIIVVPAKVKASLIVREMLSGLIKPVVAHEITSDSILIKHLHMYFHPVHAFEFKWVGQNRFSVLEIEPITGELVTGKAIKQKLGEIFSETSLFEIGSEVAGLVIPGGELAAKLARAVFSK